MLIRLLFAKQNNKTPASPLPDSWLHVWPIYFRFGINILVLQIVRYRHVYGTKYPTLTNVYISFLICSEYFREYTVLCKSTTLGPPFDLFLARL